MSEPATIRARLALTGKADAANSQRAVDALQKSGFSVVHASPHGVDFEGDGALFEKVFGSAITSGKSGPAFASSPRLPAELADVAASVYLPRKPQYFG